MYGITKYNGEMLVKQLLGSTKTQTIIFRLLILMALEENLNNLKKGMVSIYSSYVWRKKPIIVKGHQKDTEILFILKIASLYSLNVLIKILRIKTNSFIF